MSHSFDENTPKCVRASIQRARRRELSRRNRLKPSRPSVADRVVEEKLPPTREKCGRRGQGGTVGVYHRHPGEKGRGRLNERRARPPRGPIDQGTPPRSSNLGRSSSEPGDVPGVVAGPVMRASQGHTRDLKGAFHPAGLNASLPGELDLQVYVPLECVGHRHSVTVAVDAELAEVVRPPRAEPEGRLADRRRGSPGRPSRTARRRRRPAVGWRSARCRTHSTSAPRLAGRTGRTRRRPAPGSSPAGPRRSR